MKKCPYCSETIQSEAIKCRYCGKPLDKVDIEPYFYMLITAPVSWFLSMFLWEGMEGGSFEAYLFSVFVLYSLVGGIFGYYRPLLSWKWGLLASIPMWFFFLFFSFSYGLLMRVDKSGDLFIALPLISTCSGCLGAYVGARKRL